MKKIYWLYRLKLSAARQRQSPSFVLGAELSDYVNVWVLNIYDQIINDKRYTWELAPWVKNKARFMIIEYNEVAVPEVYINMVMQKMAVDFYAEFFEKPAGAKKRLKESTDIEETDNWFLIHEWIDTEEEEFPPRYLVID